MARRRLPDPAQVSIGLKVSEADAAGIDEVLTRPEFAGWTRSEWCREIIRTALRYYVGDGPAPDPGRARTSVRPAPDQPAPAAQPAPPAQPPPPAEPEPPAARAPVPAVSTSSPAGEPAAGEAGEAGTAGPVPPAAGEPGAGNGDAPESPAQPECRHPAEARDWQTGSCAACGAILWD